MRSSLDQSRTGYLHPRYAETLSFAGSPRLLENSGGWIIERQIPDTENRDGMGVYPVFVCNDWTGLPSDLDAAGRSGLVSVVLVTDPFSTADLSLLRSSFDLMAPFKEHFVVPLVHPPERSRSDHHRKKVRLAHRRVQAEKVEDPALLDVEWLRLYQRLVDKHGIAGLTAFPEHALIGQLRVPGSTLFRARVEDRTVSMGVWYRQGSFAYYHLSASDDEGYRLSASYALVSLALQHFHESGVLWASLGATAGLEGDVDDGLSYFKSGWASETRTVYLCGKVLDRGRYEQLSAERGSGKGFPAYRFP